MEDKQSGRKVNYHMWKQIADWFGALLITAAVAVAVFGAAEWIEQRSVTAVAAVETVADGFTVVVDAGHGGSDGGAVGTDTGVKEAGLNLMVATRVANLLSQQGITVLMSRTGEEALGENKRADLAARKALFNRPEVDLVVSVHMNKFTDRSISGAMAYYMAGSTEGQKLPQTVIDKICEAVERPKRLANPGDYFVIRECVCPSVLVECGFLSNSTDEKALQDPAHQEKLARAIVEGIMGYLEGKSG